MAESGPGPQTVTCPKCGRSVPPMAHCVECGHPLGPDGSALRAGYAASPHEAVRSIRMFTTLFPHLPHGEIDGFRAAFVAGLVLVVLLVLAGAYPLALVCSALIVPLLFLLYFFAVDIYEGEPRKIVLATLAWGVVAGLISGLVVRAIAYATGGGGVTLPPDIVVRDGVATPILEAALVLLGPLFLLRYRAFDDVLDGATFGTIAASVMAGVTVLVRSFDLLQSGFLPGGDPYSWLVEVATIGVAYPVVFAASIGSVSASIWLRYRAPVADRADMGLLGRPAVAGLAAAAMLAVSGLARVLLGSLAALVVLAATAAVALLWLRLTVHVGLREEAAIGVDPSDVRCAECGHLTSRRAFCGFCGVSLRAVPLDPGTRSSRAGGAEPVAPHRRHLHGRRAIAVYLGALVVTLAVGSALMVYLAPHAPVSNCPPLPAPCAAPPVNAPGPPAPLPHDSGEVLIAPRSVDEAGNCTPTVGSIGTELVLGQILTLGAVGVAFVYDDCLWTVLEADTSHALLELPYRSHPPATLRIEGVPTATRSPQDEVFFLRAQDAGLNARPDSSDYYRINGPEIGYVSGSPVGQSYAGTVFDTDGLPAGPGEWSYVAASNGTTTVAVEVFDEQPDALVTDDDSLTFHTLTRQTADELIKDVRWSPAQ